MSRDELYNAGEQYKSRIVKNRTNGQQLTTFRAFRLAFMVSTGEGQNLFVNYSATMLSFPLLIHQTATSHYTIEHSEQSLPHDEARYSG